MGRGQAGRRRGGPADGVVVAVLLVLVVGGVALLGGGRGQGSDEPREGSAAARSTEAPGVPGSAERARVVGHVDGDTVRLVGVAGSRLLPAGETTVRLLQVDTPEHPRAGRPEECYAQEASEALATLLPVGAVVWVERDEELLDRYDRTLLYVWTGEGDLVNLELLRRGYARAVLFEPNDEHVARMRQAEREARVAGRGLWGACPGG